MATSPFVLPFQLVLPIFSGWVNRRQLDVIEYVQEENRLLKEQLGGLCVNRRIYVTSLGNPTVRVSSTRPSLRKHEFARNSPSRATTLTGNPAVSWCGPSFTPRLRRRAPCPQLRRV